MKTIVRSDITYAVVGNVSESVSGWKFSDDESSPLQWGYGLFSMDEQLFPHFHKVRDRIKKHKTNEFIYVVRGSIQLNFYENKNCFYSEILTMGGFAHLIDGIHGIQVLTDDTCLLEIKNGPFVSVETDKERI